MILTELIKRLYLQQRIRSYRKMLDRSAVIGQNFCAATTQGEAAVLQFLIRNRSGDRERIRIGNHCNLNGAIVCDQYGQITVGDYVYMSSRTVVRAVHGVTIGSHCMFGPDVIVWDTDNHPLSRSKRHAQAEMIPSQLIDPREASGGPIEIGNDAWICMGALILGGVKIGDGAIVAARAVVTRDVAPMAIVAGIPSRVVGTVPV